MLSRAWLLAVLLLVDLAASRKTKRELLAEKHGTDILRPPKPPVELAKEIEALAVDPWKAREKSKKAGKPIMVMITKPGCPACVRIKEDINAHADTLRMGLAKFVFVHADQEDKVAMRFVEKLLKPSGTTVETYVPSFTFLAPGATDSLGIKGPNKEYARHYASAHHLEVAMGQALRTVDARKTKTQESWRTEIRVLHEQFRPEVDVEHLIQQNEGKLLTLLKRVKSELEPGDGRAAAREGAASPAADETAAPCSSSDTAGGSTCGDSRVLGAKEEL